MKSGIGNLVIVILLAAIAWNVARLTVLAPKEDENAAVVRTYQSFQNAIQAKDAEALRELIASDYREELLGGEFAAKLDLIQQMTPPDAKITKTTVSEDTATLDLEAHYQDQKMTGTAELLKESGKWRLKKVSWAMKIEMDDMPEAGGMAGAVGPFLPDPKEKAQAQNVLEGHQGEVSCLAFTPDSRFLVSASYGDFSIRVWDPAAGEQISSAKTENRVRSMAVTPDGGAILTADAYENIVSWPLTEGQIGAPRTLLKKAGDALALSRDGKLLAATAFRKPIWIWRTAGWQPVRDLSGSESQRVLCFAPSGGLLASGGSGNTYTLWATDTWKGTAHKIAKVQGEVCAIDISPDGKLLATGHNDSSIVFFDLKTGKEIRNTYVQNASTSAVRFSPDSAILATANNQAVFLWDAATGRGLGHLAGHKERVLSLAFSPDGRTLASGGEDKKIILWRAGDRK